ncbi:RNA ligase/cyclic nucleotide phosphodiesterase [Aspergillus crustosus]
MSLSLISRKAYAYNIEPMALSKATPSQPQTNPFEQLILDSHNNPHEIQSRYETHRTNRNARSREKLLHQDFPGWQTDSILSKLIAATNNAESPFTDHRHNLNLYARPPRHIRELIAEIQQEIRDVASTLWFLPPESLHITTLEIASSRTADEIDALAASLLNSGTASKLVNYTSDTHHRARLVKPVVSYDSSATALSFLPAAGEPTAHSKEVERPGNDDSNDGYSYHHLRRDLAGLVLDSGVSLGARYVVPSAHVTIARFVERDGKEVDEKKVAALVERIERVNATLRERYWPEKDGSVPVKGEWVVGQEYGLEFNKGTSWYGGGEKVLVGKGSQ